MSAENAFKPRVAEFFAGIGLVRMALEQAGFTIVFANDIDKKKRDIYSRNFDTSSFVRDDIRNVAGKDIPDVELATASFPCTDVSVAGNRAGLAGDESSLLAEFLRVVAEMDHRKPKAILIENVTGFATSNGGHDLHATIATLNELGYDCDLLVLDARRFVPQSRPRLFIVSCLSGLVKQSQWSVSGLRPSWIFNFAKTHTQLRLQALPLLAPPDKSVQTLHDIIEPIPATNPEWWDIGRLGAFLTSLSPVNSQRLELMRRSESVHCATAYRRTRNGSAVWEIRGDNISGCLRTARGGSSKQALVEAGQGRVQVRWMTAREYARLQGAPAFNWDGATENQAKFALGDGVCVPAVAWLAATYLLPVVKQTFDYGNDDSVFANVQ